ncbi:hypothetical protein WME94_15565 [Sorangium sp. So ce429]
MSSAFVTAERTANIITMSNGPPTSAFRKSPAMKRIPAWRERASL